MGKATGFLQYLREQPEERNPRTRLADWNEFSTPFDDETLKRQGARCMDCGTPFCHIGMEIGGTTSGCPIHNLIPEWNDLVYKGNWKEALDRLVKTNNFPEFTGRVCPAPCEGSCTLAISDPAVTIKNIERTIIDKGFENGWIDPRVPNRRTGKKVAIVGSGPAGLAAADQLNQAGHSVTVFERADRPGGLLMYGIPNMKLEKSIVERRIGLLEKEGIKFVTHTEVGVDVTYEELRHQFDSIILCTGALKQRDLELEGRDANGIHFAMDYLTLATKSLLDSEFNDGQFINTAGKDVIVIGGGDTGADCVATALRQNCNSVIQFSKHPELPGERKVDNQWPAYPNVYTMDYAHKEAAVKQGADPRQYLIQTKKINKDEDGHVKSLLTVEMEKIFLDDGTYYYEEVPGTEREWSADFVFIAIGFEGTEVKLLDHFGIEHQRSKAKSRYGDFTTNVEGVFAAGDVRRGQSLIVWAISEGREVAKQVDLYLMGEEQAVLAG